MKTKKVKKIALKIVAIMWLAGFTLASILAIWTNNQVLAGNIALTSATLLCAQLITIIVFGLWID
jgi:hypothetical protein